MIIITNLRNFIWRLKAAKRLLKEMKKLVLIATLFSVLAVLAMPLTALAGANETVTTAYLNPAADVAVAGGDGDGFEGTASNAYLDGDPGVATDASSGKNNNLDPVAGGTDKHNYYNYGITTIPSTATINGIEVRVEISVDATTDTPFTAIRLSWDGGANWTAVIQQDITTTLEAPYTYGGPANNWGRTWAVSDLSDANFRVQIINGDIGVTSTTTWTLDWIPVKVTYTAVWDSYKTDYGVDVWGDSAGEPFDHTSTTVYMEGTGFTQGTDAYKVAYYDKNGIYVTADTLLDVAADNILQSSYLLTLDIGAAGDGFWHAVAYEEAGTIAQPYDATDTDILANDSFYVAQSAIPEFPTIMAAIGVAGLCFGIYFWMRRRVHRVYGVR